MTQKEQLTTQRVRSLFKSNFDLATYAIRLARYEIKSGQEVTVTKLLDEVARNPQKYDSATLVTLEKIEEPDTEL